MISFVYILCAVSCLVGSWWYYKGSIVIDTSKSTPDRIFIVLMFAIAGVDFAIRAFN